MRQRRLTREVTDALWVAVGEELDARERAKRATAPLWLRRCREGAGDGTAKFMHDDGQMWDVYRAELSGAGAPPEVFAPRLAARNGAEVKELLEGLLQANQTRVLRATAACAPSAARGGAAARLSRCRGAHCPRCSGPPWRGCPHLGSERGASRPPTSPE